MKTRISMPLIIAIAIFLGSCAAPEKKVVTAKPVAEPVTPREPARIGDLDSNLTDLTNQITNSLTETKRTRIAIIEFSDLEGNITEFGKFLSEELITRLFMTRRFEVVERQMLNRIIKEHKLTYTHFFDEESVKAIGKLLGVDAIASGSVTDLGRSVKVNARLIATETGSIFAVASVEILKDDSVARLLAKKAKSYYQERKMDIETAATPSAPQKKVVVTEKPMAKEIAPVPEKPKHIFFEDFSTLEEGTLPEDWLGGDNLAVSKERGKNVLKRFQKGALDITTNQINFPKNFRITIKLKQNGYIIITLGKLEIHLHISVVFGDHWVMIRFENKDSVKTTSEVLKENTAYLLGIEKIGDVYKLYLNNTKVFTGRYKDVQPNNIRFFTNGDYTIYFIRVESLKILKDEKVARLEKDTKKPIVKNIALNSKVKASSYSTLRGDHSPKKAVDGDWEGGKYLNSWAAKYRDPNPWIKILFDKVYSITEIRVKGRDERQQWYDDLFKDIDIIFSDGTSLSFTLRKTRDWQTIPVNSVKSSSAKIIGKSSYRAERPGFNEIEIYGY